MVIKSKLPWKMLTMLKDPLDTLLVKILIGFYLTGAKLPKN